MGPTQGPYILQVCMGPSSLYTFPKLISRKSEARDGRTDRWVQHLTPPSREAA